MTETAGHRETRERVLEAAGELFAEKGFRDATVREIKDRAGANIAAVNYYFRDKETLHLEALRRAFLFIRDNVTEPALALDRPAAERLRAYVRALLESMLRPSRPAWHGKLIVRELGDPTEGFRQVLRDVGLPNIQRLLGLLAELAPTPPGDERLRLNLMSLFGQCVYYRNAKPVVLETLGLTEYTDEVLSRIVDHVTEFTLAGIRGSGGAD